MNDRSADTTVALLTQDDELRDQVLALTTAAALRVQACLYAVELAAVWSRAGVVVVGVDQAAEVSRLGLGRRPEVLLVGGDGDAVEAVRWSAALGAAVVLLPGGAPRLTAALASSHGPAGQGRLVGVLGGSGGVGASTLAAALAIAAGRRGTRCALVDLDPYGGGLDLLLGAELEPGWRWPRLAGVRGRLGDLGSELVRLEALDLLSMGRGRDAPPGPEQIAAALDATARSHRLTVVDLPRGDPDRCADVVRRSDWLVVVVRADVRGLAAAGQVLNAVPDTAAVGLVPRGRGLSGSVLTRRLALRGETSGEARTVAEFGRLEDDPAVHSDAERGDPPGRSGRSRLGRLAATILDHIEEPAHRERVGAA